MADCPKCRGRMTRGLAFVPDLGAKVKWMDGEAGVWATLKTSLGLGGRGSDLVGRRCGECGYVEFFTDTAAKPVKTLSSVDEETERLRGVVATLQERIAVLETIATDPGERTSREIDRLR
jgi:predicted nucleic-acid-binding Zn-ribbon protein